MLKLLILLGFVAATPAMAAAPPADQAAFEQAMARKDAWRAAELLDALVAARRPADGRLRPHPFLSGLAGRYLLIQGAPALELARAHLEQAARKEVEPAVRNPAALTLASLLLQRGNPRDASLALEVLGSDPLNPSSRRWRDVMQARIGMISDPAVQVPVIQHRVADATAPAERWEWQLLLAQAHALAGNISAAQVAADRAWDDALGAPADQFAPLRVALQRAALAARSRDRDPMLAMLDVADTTSVRIRKELVQFLPLCGKEIRPDDFVTFAVYASRSIGETQLPVDASRPQVIRWFVDALANRTLLEASPVAPAGTILTVRCRSFPSAAADWPSTDELELARWLAARGLFFTFGEDSDDIRTVADEIDMLSERHGPDHPLVSIRRLDLVTLLRQRAVEQQDVEEWQVTQHENKAYTALRAAGGLEDLLPLEERIRLERAIVRAETPEDALRTARATMPRLIERERVNRAYTIMLDWFEGDSSLSADTKEQVVKTMLLRFAKRPNDPRVIALRLQLASLQKERGATGDARETYRLAGLAENSCSVTNSGLSIEESGFGEEDFPPDAIHFEIVGRTVVEAAVTAEGRIGPHRIIFSSPAALFDSAAEEGLLRLRYKAARPEERLRACQGAIIPLEWRLPEEEQFQFPIFKEPDESAS